MVTRSPNDARDEASSPYIRTRRGTIPARGPVGADAGDEDLATAIGLYVLGELTPGQAAERAGVSRIEVREVLVEAGIQPRLGPRTEAGAPDEVRTTLDLA